MIVDIPVKDIMTREVVTVSPIDNMIKVQEIFGSRDFHHIPVVDESGVLVGLLSKLDYSLICDRFTHFNTSRSEKVNKKFFEAILVQDVMTSKMVTLSPDDSVFKAVDLIRENLFHSFPIVNEDDQLMGIITSYDLLTYAYARPSVLTETNS